MNSGKKIAINAVLYSTLCVLVIAVSFGLGYVTRAAVAPVSQESASMSLFWEAWGLIQDYYYGQPIDNTTRTYGALHGSISALEDPYTSFVVPQVHEQDQEDLRGSFGGIGAWIERTEDGRILLTPMEDRPAANAGILAGDELIAVDGTSITTELSLDEVVRMVKGESGQIVVLTIQREGSSTALTFEVERKEIVTDSVYWVQLEQDPSIAHIQLRIFGERTGQELEEAIKELDKLGIEKFILDLRDNGGGLLDSAVDVTSQFLKDGVVLYESNSDGKETPYSIRKKKTVTDAEVVVLINGNTASASEIVAGAIQDTERGVLVGTTSFGKASVQLVFDLSDGSSVHVTSAHWLTPNKRDINGIGLEPEFFVEITAEDIQQNKDPQLDAAITYLQESGD